MKVVTFSRQYPAYHPKAGQPTSFVEKIWAGLADLGWQDVAPDNLPTEIFTADFQIYMSGGAKYHTIREGHRWKVGEYFSPRMWSGKAYRSPQMQFAPAIRVEKVWDIEISPLYDVLINGEQ